MPARTPPTKADTWFTNPGPGETNHRRYEALRAYFTEKLTYQQAADRFGYKLWAFVNLVRDYRAGKLDLFAPRAKPGPPKGAAPAKERARGRVVELRRDGLSTYEISARLSAEHTPLNRTSVGEVLQEEGFGRLIRHPATAASQSPATPGRDTRLPKAARIDWDAWPARADTRHAGLLLLLPDLVSLDLPGLVRAARYPSTRGIPATSWVLSLLALKLTGARRVSHVDDLLLADPAAALFAGLDALPKKTALTDYSYRTCHDNQAALLGALGKALARLGLAGPAEGVFDLDFHAIMHWGHDPVLEKHYVPTRSQRARSVLTFVAQDRTTHNLVYANADLSKATQSQEVIAFCDHWKRATGRDPAMLVMDQKVTTGQVLGRLDQRGVAFTTLRMRSKPLMEHIDTLTPKDFKTITLDRPGPHNRPRVHEDPAARLTGYPGAVRQLVVTGLGRDTPTVIITNDTKTPARQIVSLYAKRMTIEQRLAEIIGAFGADALSSTVNLNVDLDIALCVLAQNAVASLADRLPGYAGKTPDVIQRRFLETPGTIETTPHDITVHLDRRAYSPTLRQADLRQNTPVPWLGGRQIHYNPT
jgi:hypothetical protein